VAQIIVRNLEPELKDRLRRRASAHGHSMEQEARDILRAAMTADAPEQTGNLGTRISQRFAGIGRSADIPELRGEAARPAEPEA